MFSQSIPVCWLSFYWRKLSSFLAAGRFFLCVSFYWNEAEISVAVGASKNIIALMLMTKPILKHSLSINFLNIPDSRTLQTSLVSQCLGQPVPLVHRALRKWWVCSLGKKTSASKAEEKGATACSEFWDLNDVADDELPPPPERKKRRLRIPLLPDIRCTELISASGRTGGKNKRRRARHQDAACSGSVALQNVVENQVNWERNHCHCEATKSFLLQPPNVSEEPGAAIATKIFAKQDWLPSTGGRNQRT